MDIWSLSPDVWFVGEGNTLRNVNEEFFSLSIGSVQCFHAISRSQAGLSLS